VDGDADTATAGEAEPGDPQTCVQLRGHLPDAELDTLCTELAHFDGSVATAIDLVDLGLLQPSTLALLVASLRQLHHGDVGCLGHITPCHETDRCLDADAIAQLARDDGSRWQDCGDGRELGWQIFSSGEGVQRAAHRIVAQLRRNTSWPLPSVAQMASLAFELSENVRQHSGGNEGVVALETDSSGAEVRMAIADTGIGIRASLARNPKYADLDDDDDLIAIEAAMCAGESAEPGAGGGMGLYLARNAVRRNGGRLLLRSGEARCEEGDERWPERHLPRLRGTLIGIQASTDEPLDDDAVWARVRELGQPRRGAQQ